MSNPVKPPLYRDFIDSLVKTCKSGQGQIGANRARAGVWNKNATVNEFPDQHEINQLLARLSPSERETLARLLEASFRKGVFESLKALGDFRVDPFTSGYEGEAYHDFVGRMDNWEWPNS